VISVVEPSCNAADDLASDSFAGRCATRRHMILEQIDGEDPYDAPWPVTVVPGSPVTLIADAANGTACEMLILGLPRRDLVTFRAENALRIARRIMKPVIAVHRSLRGPPSSCVAAIDFSKSSLLAARVAATLLAPGGTLFLAHVQPRVELGLQDIYSQGITGAFERLTRDLAAPDSVHVKPALLHGEPRVDLPTFCDQVNADLVAVGTSRVDAAHLHRARLSSGFMRSADRSVLIAPAHATGLRCSSSAH
jgi:nucleotide-binding universal stress UspA family protein